MTLEPRGNRDDLVHASAFGDESAASDEAWTALAQLLDAAQPDFDAALDDEAAWIGGVRRRVAQRRKQAKRRVLAAAAALLACCGAGWIAASRMPQRAAAPEPPDAAPAAFAVTAAWDDDELDLELAWTLRHAATIESQWRRPADRLAFVRQQMDELQAEFDGDSL
ncbi:MAG TPA: hypothetical protein VMV10_22845 [Pirellulales bacterium]|nr:hypothetical protein [Pirellulales bacterium]